MTSKWNDIDKVTGREGPFCGPSFIPDAAKVYLKRKKKQLLKLFFLKGKKIFD